MNPGGRFFPRNSAHGEYAHGYLRLSYRDLGFIQQAIYCFQQALKADKSDVDAMWDRAILLKDVGQTKQVKSSC